MPYAQANKQEETLINSKKKPTKKQQISTFNESCEKTESMEQLDALRTSRTNNEDETTDLTA